MSSQLDPRTAYVGYGWPLPPRRWPGRRSYLWYDPEFRLPGIADYHFRAMHPEIADDDWEQLFEDAHERATAAFIQHAQGVNAYKAFERQELDRFERSLQKQDSPGESELLEWQREAFSRYFAENR